MDSGNPLIPVESYVIVANRGGDLHGVRWPTKKWLLKHNDELARAFRRLARDDAQAIVITPSAIQCVEDLYSGHFDPEAIARLATDDSGIPPSSH